MKNNLILEIKGFPITLVFLELPQFSFLNKNKSNEWATVKTTKLRFLAFLHLIIISLFKIIG